MCDSLSGSHFFDWEETDANCAAQVGSRSNTRCDSSSGCGVWRQQFSRRHRARLSVDSLAISGGCAGLSATLLFGGGIPTLTCSVSREDGLPGPVRRVVLIRGSAIPFDVSPARIRALTGGAPKAVLRQHTEGKREKDVASTMARGQQTLRIVCPLRESLSPRQLQLLVAESSESAGWAAIDSALSAPPSGRAAGLSDKLANLDAAGSAAVFNFDDCGGNGEQLRTHDTRADRITRQVKVHSRSRSMASMGDCDCPGGPPIADMRQTDGAGSNVSNSVDGLGGDCDPPMLVTVHVTATPDYNFLSHDTIICFVFGKCASQWGSGDAWWGETDLWVHYDGGGGSGGLWGPGSAPPAPPPVDTSTPLAADTIPNCADPNIRIQLSQRSLSVRWRCSQSTRRNRCNSLDGAERRLVHHVQQCRQRHHE